MSVYHEYSRSGINPDLLVCCKKKSGPLTVSIIIFLLYKRTIIPTGIDKCNMKTMIGIIRDPNLFRVEN